MAGTREKQADAPLTSAADEFAALELSGGRPCLDFINTVDPRLGDAQHDYLASYADLVRWFAYAKLLSEAQVASLLRVAARQPRAAHARFARAVALREALYRVFSTIAAQQAPSADDLATIQATYAKMLAQARLVATSETFAWGWPEGADVFDLAFWTVIQSAVELLTAPELRRVKVCPGLNDCGWLFLDTSKSGRRRWCSMEGCGSRAKMRSYYARTHTRVNGRQDATAAPAATASGLGA